MEHAVNDLMHAVWKMQMVSSAVHANWDFGRSNPYRYKLAGISGPQMQVSGGQEHISSHVRCDIPFVIVVVTVHKKFVSISDGGRYKVAGACPQHSNSCVLFDHQCEREILLTCSMRCSGNQRALACTCQQTVDLCQKRLSSDCRTNAKITSQPKSLWGILLQ